MWFGPSPIKNPGYAYGHEGTRNLFQSESNEQGEDLRLKGIFRPKSEIQAKSNVSPQKTPIWDSICTPVATSLLISLGHKPRLGGHNFRLGGTSSHLGGHGPGMPPAALGLC